VCFAFAKLKIHSMVVDSDRVGQRPILPFNATSPLRVLDPTEDAELRDCMQASGTRRRGRRDGDRPQLYRRLYM
jgi:hypothetical protein